MSLSWKLLPLAVLAAAGFFALLPGGSASPHAVDAAFVNCGQLGNPAIRVNIRMVDQGGTIIPVAGSTITIVPDPSGFGGGATFVDEGNGDALTGNIGVIQVNNVYCTTEGSVYQVNLQSLPVGSNCSFDTANRSINVQPGQNQTVDLLVRNCTLATPTTTATITPTLTVTPTVTTTPSAPGAITVSAAPTSLNCSGSSFITVVVKSVTGANVADGTSVSVTSSIGSLSPTQATTASGGILTLFSAPAASGGTATITATAAGVSGTATVQVNCNAQPTPVPTNPPPPTVVIPTVIVPPPVSGIVRPPNTGDAGLADGSHETRVYAGVVLLAMALLGASVLVRKRS